MGKTDGASEFVTGSTSATFSAAAKPGEVVSALAAANDTNRVRLLSQLCWEYRMTDFLQAVTYGREALELSQTLKFFDGEAQVQNYLGVVYRNLGDYARAMNAFFQARRIAESYGIYRELGYAHNNIGDAYRLQFNYPQALESISKARDIFFRLHDSSGVAYAELRMGEVLQFQNKYDSALQFYERALTIRRALRDTAQMGTCMMRIGQVEQMRGSFNEALLVFHQALSLGKKAESNDIANSIARTYLSIGDYPNAIRFAKQGLERAQRLQAKQAVETATNILHQSYAALGDFKQSYAYQTMMIEAIIHIRNESVNRKLAIIEVNDQIAQRETEAAIAAKDQAQSRVVIAAFGVGLVLLSWIAIGTFGSAKRQKAANAEITRQQVILEEQAATIEAANTALEEKNIALDRSNTELAASNRDLEKYFRIVADTNAKVQHQVSLQQGQALQMQIINAQLAEKNAKVEQTLQQLKETETQLVQSERMSAMGVLTAGVMHEINNPNAAVYAATSGIKRKITAARAYFLDLLDESDRTSDAAQGLLQILDETDEIAAVAHDGADRIKAIVAKLQNFSKHQRTGAVTGSIAAELRSTVELFRYQFPNVQCAISADESITMSANFGELNQVFLNLLVNAAQAGATAIQLAIELRFAPALKKNLVKITIQDNGPGIPIEIQKRIFEPFYSTKGVGNTGLGLTISKNVIEQHEGVIDLKSEPNKGTRFTILLPEKSSES